MVQSTEASLTIFKKSIKVVSEKADIHLKKIGDEWVLDSIDFYDTEYSSDEEQKAKPKPPKKPKVESHKFR